MYIDDPIEPSPIKSTLRELFPEMFSNDGGGPTLINDDLFGSGVPICDVDEESARNLQRMPYEQYLGTFYWSIVKKRARWMFDYTCGSCGAIGLKLSNLHVHHLNYERRGCELWTDVIIFCKQCHERTHNRTVGLDG